ncbi:hypothetical protein DFR58_101169 [Anaerobacterium chartisolvens]|uniref:Uncharacterized protein n=1 Tax=Anaerobacterium chartisolvens TaxID=1297424 RepID=A0A369BI82_9FIRM|nr:hypothetical protein DFR58_101169 [Anaerobacterium chartisolvens]
MTIIEKKIKAYRFSILMAIICVILSGVNYVIFKVPAVGVAFIIVTITCIITIICYRMDKISK